MQTPPGPPPDDRPPGASPGAGAPPAPGAASAPPWADAPPTSPFAAPAALTAPPPAAAPDALPPVAAGWGAPPPAGPGRAPPAELPPPTYVPSWAAGASAAAGEPAPRWIASSALPPGYQPDSNTGQPDVLVFFRIYAGLACLGGVGMTCNGIYEGVQHMSHGGASLVMPVMTGVFGTLTFGAYLIGVVAPRKPWMHVVGILQIGLGILGSCCTWPIVVPLLIYWLKPEVKKWFDEGAERRIEG